MIVKIATGYSIQGAARYHLHDKNTLESAERVAWTHTENSAFDEPAHTLREMLHTARQNPAASKTAVTVMLAWAKDEDPSREHMIEAGRGALHAQGLHEHQALFVCHNDEPQPHLHILVNRVHPETHRSHGLPFYQLTAQKWALDYEQEHGLRCTQRLANQQQRERGDYVRYQDDTVLAAWQHSDSGRAFRAFLDERGWQLAYERRTTRGGREKDNLFAITPSGRALDILRELNRNRPKGERLTKAQFRQRFADLDLDQLPTSGEADRAMKAKYHQERQQQKARALHAGAAPQQKPQRRRAQQRQADATQARQDFAAATGRNNQARTRPSRARDASRTPPEVWDRDAYTRQQDEKLIDAALEADRRRQAEETQRGRVEAWGNRQLADQQDRHIAERETLNQTLFDKRQQASAAISRRYRLPQQHLQQRIETLEDKLDRGGLFYWRAARRADREQLGELKQALATERHNESTELNALNQAEARQKQALAQRQAIERQALQQQIGEALARREIPQQRQAEVRRQRDPPARHREPQQSPQQTLERNR